MIDECLERRLDEVIAAYVQAVEAGESPDREELLRRYPNLADALRNFLADFDRVDRQAAPLRAAAGPVPVPEALRDFGDYELLEEIGRGGMGVVYKARQKSLDRLVALKMILTGRLANAEDVARFHREVEAIVNLDHPRIVPVYEVGEHLGHPYYVMKLFEEGDLTRHLERYADNPDLAATVVAQVAQAVHHAHQRGVLHRDLKPANILLDADGRPHVGDFGLARRLADPALTQSNAVVGTLGYMAPEQALGRKDLTTAADVYSLGAILHALLIGRPPYQGETVLTTLRGLTERRPLGLRRLNPKVRRDLETICLKCLEENPARRYSSAEALADDLLRYLRGDPILARPAGVVRRTARWVRRQPAVAAMFLLVLLVAAAGVAGIVWKAREVELADQRVKDEQEKVVQGVRDLGEARKEFDRVVTEEERRLEAVRRRGRAADHRDRVARAVQSLQVGDWRAAEEVLDDCPWDMRGWEWDFLRGQALEGRRLMEAEQWKAKLARYEATDKPQREFAELWDQTRRAVLKVDRAAALPQTHTVRLAVASGSWPADWQVDTFGDRPVALSPDGRRLAVAGYHPGPGQAINLAAMTAGAAENPWTVLASVVTPARSYKAHVEVWDTHTGARLTTFRGHRTPVTCLAFSPDGERILSVSAEPLKLAPDDDQDPGRPWLWQTLLVWQAATGNVVEEQGSRRSAAHNYTRVGITVAAAFLPDGQRLLGDHNGSLHVWERRESNPEAMQRLGYAPVADRRWPEGSNDLFRWSFQGRLSDWFAEWRLEYFHRWFARPLQIVTDRDGIRCLAGSDYEGAPAFVVRGADQQKATSPWLHPTHAGVQSLAITADGRLGASGHQDGLICMYDLTAREVRALLRGHTGSVRGLAFTPDGRRVVSGSDDGTVRLWDTDGGGEVYVLAGSGKAVLRVGVSGDGRTITAVDADFTARRWEVTPGLMPAVLHARPPVDLAASAPFLAARAEAREFAGGHRPDVGSAVQVFDLRTGAAIFRVAALRESTARLSPDGSRLALYRLDSDHAGHRTNLLELWDVPSGKRIWSGPKIHGIPESMVWSPDGRQLALIRRQRVQGPPAGRAGEVLRAYDWDISWHVSPSVVLLDAATGEELSSFSLGVPDTWRGSTFSLVFSPDSCLLAVHGSAWSGLSLDYALQIRHGPKGKTIQLEDERGEHPIQYGRLTVHEVATGRIVFEFHGTSGVKLDGEDEYKEKRRRREVLDRLGVGASHGEEMPHVVFSPDGLRIAAEGRGWDVQWIKEWSLHDGRETWSGKVPRQFAWPSLSQVKQRQESFWSDCRVVRLVYSDEGRLCAWVNVRELGLRLDDLAAGKQLLFLKDFEHDRSAWEQGRCAVSERWVVGSRNRAVRPWVDPTGGQRELRSDPLLEVLDLGMLPLPSVQQVERPRSP